MCARESEVRKKIQFFLVSMLYLNEKDDMESFILKLIQFFLKEFYT